MHKEHCDVRPLILSLFEELTEIGTEQITQLLSYTPPRYLHVIYKPREACDH